jgi:hypothetical protein
VKGYAWSWLLAAAVAFGAAGCVMDEEGGGGKAAEAAKKDDKKADKPADKGAPIPDNPWKGTGLTVWEDKDGRQWVFLEKKQDKELLAFLGGKESAKKVTRVGAGIGGKTLQAVDASALDAYAAWKPGFVVRVDKDGRVYVFKEGAKELADFDKQGELAKHVTRVGAGPGGATLKGPDNETLDAWTKKKYP